ncbi:MAG TPA: 50S ribosomal protein L31e [Candidatus Bathyarchaeia archaeon]|nr:50S ribosomal protein L31e [Candidatus Bathyarchaeia archaeon]
MTAKKVATEEDADIEPSNDVELSKIDPGTEGSKAEEETEELESDVKSPETPEAPAAEEAAEEEEEIEIVEEKFYDLNLRRIWTAPREKRTPRAIRYVRQYAAQRMKTDNVSLSEETNSLLWARGISKPPRKIRIRVVKDKEGKVIVFPGEGK